MSDKSPLPIFVVQPPCTVKKAVVAVVLNGETLYSETLNLDSGGARAEFVGGWLKRFGVEYPAMTAEYCEKGLMRCRDKLLAGMPAVTAELNEPLYTIAGGCVCERGMDGGAPIPACDFSAILAEEILLDNGQEKTALYRIEGQTQGGQALPSVEVPATDFKSLTWIETNWLSQAIVYPRKAEVLPVAIKYVSRPVKRRSVYTHTGWREISGRWVYLHGGGAIGGNGATEGVEVRLEPGLPVMANYKLPAPPEGIALRNAVAAVVRLFGLTADRISFPLFAAVWRAVLGPSDYTVFLHGTTGGCKTAMGCLASQGFGAGLARDCGHMNWNSTANQLEMAAFILKDTLCYIDDFKPPEDRLERGNYFKTARRMINAQADRAGRGRLSQDRRSMSSHAPRGTLLTTGEEKVRGDSTQGRIVFLSVHSDDLDPASDPAAKARLDACQADAAGAQYSNAMAGFLRWLAPQYPAMRMGLLEQIDKVRSNCRIADAHPRASGNLSNLYAGMVWFARFAEVVGAMTSAEASRFRGRGWLALLEAGELQARDRPETDPTRVFLRLLGAALRGGIGYIASKDGKEPTDPERWGWRARMSGGSREGQGRRFGWFVQQGFGKDGPGEDELWLEPDSAYALAQQMAGEQGTSFPVEADTLWAQLREKKLLRSLGPRGAPKSRKRFGGDRVSPVIVLAGSALDGYQEDGDQMEFTMGRKAAEPSDADEDA